MPLIEKTVIVTGGTRGIGAAIAEKFIQTHGKVILTGRNENELDRLQKIAPANVSYVQLDLGDVVSLQNFLTYMCGLQSVDVFINNAGINRIALIDDISDNDFEDILQVNLRAPFYLSRQACKLMKKDGGKIVNIASIWSHITKPGRTSYITSKAGIAGLTRGLATDMAQFNVLVNTVSPGFVMTELTRDSLTDNEILALSEQIPAKRMAQPNEIAEVVTFLASNKNTYLTGQNITVDGGFSNV